MAPLAGDCEKAVQKTEEAFGHLDIPFNNAGLIYRAKTALETSEEEWDRTMDTNARGAFLKSKYAIPEMIKHQNIRVNCLCPGSVDTPMLRREMEEMGGETAVRPAFEAQHPLGRICTPEEVARAGPLPGLQRFRLRHRSSVGHRRGADGWLK